MSGRNRRRQQGSRSQPPSVGGFDGSFEGSCVVCTRGTDTAMGFVGEPAWAAAGLLRMGVPADQAQLTVAQWFDEPVSMRGGRHTIVMRVCRECAARGGFEVGLALVGDSIPGVTQPIRPDE